MVKISVSIPGEVVKILESEVERKRQIGEAGNFSQEIASRLERSFQKDGIVIKKELRVCEICRQKLPEFQFEGKRTKCRKCDWEEMQKRASALGINYDLSVLRTLPKEERQKINYQLRKKDLSKYMSRYNKERSMIDPNFKLVRALRSRLSGVIRKKGIERKFHTKELIGCTIDEFRKYMEDKFLPGMTWENYGKWHIDHIRPIVSFDLTDIEQQKECFHFSNLQPLWAIDNLKKGGRPPKQKMVD